MTTTSVVAQTTPALDACNVTWNTPGKDSRDSMPLGNGDIGLNVWVENGGDLLFYVSKTDAWSDNVAGNKGLVKLGRIRVKLTPNPFAAQSGFVQTLKLHDGEVAIEAGPAGQKVRLRVWVDANQPVIRVEADGVKSFEARVGFETLRPAPEKDLNADTVLGGQTDRIAWCYRNTNKRIPQLTNLTFGAIAKGDGLVSDGDAALKSRQASNRLLLSVYPMTAQTVTPEAWLAKLEAQVRKVDATDLDAARGKHREWWNAFWDRSWIYASGEAGAEQATQGYALQRFVSACSGRGAFPIKFNGSIFTVDYLKPEKVDGEMKAVTLNADTRSWGGQYWFQNTRPMYWPMLKSGDFDTMQPLFKMFRAMLPDNEKLVKEYYGHDGAYFAETKPFWGGVDNITPESPGNYTKHYYTPILELSAMMLDYYAFTGDEGFVRETLLPIADAGVKFFDGHFKRDEKGKLLLDPDNAIEMFWKVRNPAPDIAGLHWVLQGLLALPSEFGTAEMRSRWQRLLGELPDLPKGDANGKTVLMPAEKFDKSHNFENPELYAIYPFRIYGLGKPDLELARATFDARKQRHMGCWHQDGIQAALLGDIETAKKAAVFHLTRKDKQLRFPAFWDPGHDYAPDEDNGGNGLNILQQMLLQAEGSRILLLPAWPKTWNCDFKLRAPMRTTVVGRVRGGKLESCTVTPERRRKDVVVVGEGAL